MDSIEKQDALVDIARSYLLHLHLEHRWQQTKRVVFLILMLLTSFSFFWAYFGSDFYFNKKPIVAVIDIDGLIEPGSAESLAQRMKKLPKNGKIEEIVLRINSPGGHPSEAARMADIIDAVREKTGAKVTVFAGDSMASSAYIIAIRADTIVVSEYSLVGSVGAIIKSWDVSDLMQKIGIKAHVFASGQMKDMLSPTRSPEEAEREKAMDLVRQISEIFAQDVVRRRGARLHLSIDQIKTGEVWTGRQAVEYGLADRIGTFESNLNRWEGKEIVQLKATNISSWGILSSLLQKAHKAIYN